MYPRFIEPSLKEALLDTPVVCLLGPRQTGKTTLVKQIEPERPYINFDDETLLRAARQDPTGFIQGLPAFVSLDEVQRVPELLPAIKATVDTDRRPGRFLMTGSANLLLLPGVQESLAGRVEILHLQPLSEQEKQKGTSSLLSLLIKGEIKSSIQGHQDMVPGIADAVCSGGYPEPNTRSASRATRWYRQYLNAIIQRDVKDIALIRDEDEMLRLIEILSLRTASLLNVSTLANELGVSRQTTEKYISILERLFLIRRLPAWHLNQSKRLIKTPKIHLIDSGIIASLNGLKAEDWFDYSADFGNILESFVVQQLICQSGWVDSDLRFYHYRDKDKLEVDLVIESGRKLWGVEVKKASSIQQKDEAGLARLADKAGNRFQGGILLYSGRNYLPLKQKNCFAVPMDALWK